MVRGCEFSGSGNSTYGSGQRSDCLPLVWRPTNVFRGKVQGIGWAVKPEGEVDLPTRRCPLCEARTELGARRATFSRADRSGESRSQPVSHGSVSRCNYRSTETFESGFRRAVNNEQENKK